MIQNFKENNGSDGMSEGYSPPSLIQFHNSGNICPGSDNNPGTL